MGRFGSAKTNSSDPVKIVRALKELIDLLDTGYSLETVIGGNKYRVVIDATDGIAIYKGAVKIFGIDSANGRISITDDAVKLGATYNGVTIDAVNGFIASSTIGGVTVTSKQNSSQMGFYDALNNLIGGMVVINGQVVNIAQVLTNDSTDPESWTAMGDVTIGGKAYKGLFMYLKSFSETVPIAKIVNNTSTIAGTPEYNTIISFSDLSKITWQKHALVGEYIQTLVQELTTNNVSGIVATQGGASDRVYLAQSKDNNSNFAFLGVDDTGPYYQKYGLARTYF